MIEKTLVSLKDMLASGRKLFNGMKVVLPIGYVAEIYGFITIEDYVFGCIDIDNSGNISIDMPPLGEAKVLSNRVIFTINEKIRQVPIFNNVSKATEKRYNLQFLYVPKFLNLSGNKVKAYKQSMKKDIPDINVNKIESVQIENNIAYYYPSESDLFFESDSKIRGIGNGFVVITRRLSKVTDDIKYEVFNTNEIQIEKTE